MSTIYSTSAITARGTDQENNQANNQAKNLEAEKDRLATRLMNTLEESPDILELRMRIADIYIKQKQWQCAHIHLQKVLEHGAIKDSPFLFRAHIRIALILLSSNCIPFENLQKARESLEIGSQSKKILDKYNVATLLLNEKLADYADKSKAIALCLEILKDKPEHPQVNKLLSNFCWQHPSLPFKQRRRQAEITRAAADKIRISDPLTANCCLGEIAIDCLGDTEQERWSHPEQVEKLFLQEPTNLAFAKHIAVKMLHCDPAILKIADFHLSQFFTSYPNDSQLCIILTGIKEKIPNSDKQSIWDLHTHLLRLEGDVTSHCYVTTFIQRSELLLSSNADEFPQSYRETLDQEVWQFYEQCSAPYDGDKMKRLKRGRVMTLLDRDPPTIAAPAGMMLCAKLWFRYPNHFLQAYRKALTAALMAYRESPHEDTRVFISKLYKKGGFGIIQNTLIAGIWRNDFDSDDSDPVAKDARPLIRAFLDDSTEVSQINNLIQISI